jgi:starch phosphorylase
VVRDVLGEPVASELRALGELGGDDRRLNMTTLGMSMSGFVNAVSLRHREVTASMFPSSAIASITNGVHASTWTAPPMGRLFDRLLPGWRADNTMLRYAWALPTDQLDEAHSSAKRALLSLVAQRTGTALDPSVLTLGVARRATRYKRLDLLVSDPERLREIAKRAGPLQILYAGKAHPADEGGKAVIRSIYEAAEVLAGEVAVVFLEDYSMAQAALMCAGSDVWVNTPRKPAEASGTSGMKAALNGVPSLSVLDGWWCEGDVEGVTGWSIGDDGPESDDALEAEDLYAKLGSAIVPLFYGDPGRFTKIRRAAIALNGSFFTSERMVRQYAALAYRAHDHLEVPPPDTDG